MDKEPSTAAIEKANALVRAVTPENVLSSAKINPTQSYVDDAFARFIDRVSEVAEDADAALWGSGFVEDSPVRSKVRALILPDPGPDLLAAAFREAFKDTNVGAFGGYWKVLSATKEALAKRGGRIVFDGVTQP